MQIEALGPWRGAVVALLVALAAAGALRLLRRPNLATAAAGLGLAAGWLLVLGTLTASPRQLPERLPALALAAALAGLAIAAWGRAALAWAAAGCAALVGAWWLGGAPLVLADLVRAVVPLLALALLAGSTLRALDGPLPATVANVALLLGLGIAAPFGPWLPLAAALVAASVGGLAAGTAWPPGARLAPALGLTALSAGPVLARGSAADWLAGASAPVALWIGPALGARLGGRAGLACGWAIAVAAPLGLLWLMRRG